MRRRSDAEQSFLDAHPIEGASQGTAQTFESMHMNVALHDRIMLRIGDWLRKRRA